MIKYAKLPDNCIQAKGEPERFTALISIEMAGEWTEIERSCSTEKREKQRCPREISKSSLHIEHRPSSFQENRLPFKWSVTES